MTALVAAVLVEQASVAVIVVAVFVASVVVAAVVMAFAADQLVAFDSLADSAPELDLLAVECWTAVAVVAVGIHAVTEH